MSTVFVTGSTGFLEYFAFINFVGPRFDRAFVLIRHQRRNSPQQVADSTELAGESYRTMPDLEALLSRVTIVEGDISLENGVNEQVSARCVPPTLTSSGTLLLAELRRVPPRNDQGHQH